ncbi:hypothetical protein RP20_CCG017182 [Aedes albopictus]|nr:hypothetical protein RP20_CCG017182 [Aedes albopictus]
MRCFVLGCRNDFHCYKYSGETPSKFSVHRFPIDADRRMAWLEAIARAENRELDIDAINFKAIRICSNHFPESDFILVKDRKMLCKTAVPTLFGADAVEKGKPFSTESTEDSPSIPPPVRIRKSPKEAERKTKALIDGVLGCVRKRDHKKPSQTNTLFRLEKFPHVCRLCLKAPKTETEVMIPLDATDHMMDGISVGQFISEVLPEDATLEQGLQQFLPNKICLPCLELLKFFAKFRCKITIAHLLMNSLVELKQHKTSLPIVDLFKTKSDLVKTVIKDLGLCRRSRYGVRDLLKEFPRYDLASFQGFDAQEVKNEKQNDKDNFSDGEKELAPDEVIPKQEIEKDLVEELANYPVESSMIYAEECTVEELNELTKVNPDLLVMDSSNNYPTFKKEKPPAKSKYGGKKLDQPLQCPKCRYSTPYQRNFETHQEVHKKREARVYACKHPGCTEVFNTRSEYKRHGPMAHKAYICDHCGLKMSTQSELKNHLARHLHKLEHPCPYCERRHNTKTDLRNHIRYMHLSRVGYQCKICQSSFSRKYIMEEHMATHSNTYAYPCTLCDKKFNVKKYLKSHISTVHERNRLPCRYCSITYDRNYKLNNHIESAHGIQVRFVCDVCVMTYNSQDKLDVHMARHNQPHEMECGRCLTAFTSKDLLDSHPCITYR